MCLLLRGEGNGLEYIREARQRKGDTLRWSSRLWALQRVCEGSVWRGSGEVRY